MGLVSMHTLSRGPMVAAELVSGPLLEINVVTFSPQGRCLIRGRPSSLSLDGGYSKMAPEEMLGPLLASQRSQPGRRAGFARLHRTAACVADWPRCCFPAPVAPAWMSGVPRACAAAALLWPVNSRGKVFWWCGPGRLAGSCSRPPMPSVGFEALGSGLSASTRRMLAGIPLVQSHQCMHMLIEESCDGLSSAFVAYKNHLS